jgi:hypothetical protein
VRNKRASLIFSLSIAFAIAESGVGNFSSGIKSREIASAPLFTGQSREVTLFLISNTRFTLSTVIPASSAISSHSGSLPLSLYNPESCVKVST